MAKNYSLPLLFARGAPTTLESMSVAQLQAFLMFLLSCLSGNKVTTLSSMRQPSWWPKDVPFSDDLLRSRLESRSWSHKLINVVAHCYRHYGEADLLDVSRKLWRHSENKKKRFIIVDNGNGTRSFKKISDGKLMITFYSESQDYDCNSYSSLEDLSSKDNSIIEESDDIEICYESFTVCKDIGSNGDSIQADSVHPESLVSKADFLKNFNLFQTESIRNDSAKLSSPLSSCDVTKKVLTSIDLTSPLGLRLVNATNCSRQESSYHYEQDCLNDQPYLTKETKFRVTFRETRKKKNQTPHLYCFNKQQLHLRLESIKTGLSPNTLALKKRLAQKQLQGISHIWQQGLELCDKTTFWQFHL